MIEFTASERDDRNRSRLFEIFIHENRLRCVCVCGYLLDGRDSKEKDAIAQWKRPGADKQRAHVREGLQHLIGNAAKKILLSRRGNILPIVNMIFGTDDEIV